MLDDRVMLVLASTFKWMGKELCLGRVTLMMTERPLLVHGNQKLGVQIAHFDLPASEQICVGRSSVCWKECYARRGRFHFPQVRERLIYNYQQSLKSDFADRLIREIRSLGIMTVRLHCSGDVYGKKYAEDWLKVFQACPRVRFYAYTRAYKIPAIAEVLEKWAALRCVRLWYSCDSESVPASVPSGVRLAFLQTELHQQPGKVNLIFRVHRLRKKPVSIGLPMVCPSETPEGKQVSCGSCQNCFK
jgi:hypothetical protein